MIKLIYICISVFILSSCSRGEAVNKDELIGVFTNTNNKYNNYEFLQFINDTNVLYYRFNHKGVYIDTMKYCFSKAYKGYKYPTLHFIHKDKSHKSDIPIVDDGGYIIKKDGNIILEEGTAYAFTFKKLQKKKVGTKGRLKPHVKRWVE